MSCMSFRVNPHSRSCHLWQKVAQNDIVSWKNCLPVVTWNKKHLSKQIAPITYTHEKNLFAVANFVIFVSCFFSDRVKIYLDLFKSSLSFQRRENQADIVGNK